ncbi:cardiolipin synthase family protein [Campylobacter blaseri]|uniref:Phospholipase n=1 Tax=Campylobacter blaseri TaxID=2042961 RepID=A0A2P8R2E1_9BACT|nr:phospholipase D-like domain-containing protein [Campylobacter blaseri]PSM52667.1 phospholipase [Campylobacter blaseri]PSM54315.1 phospholipase [Campylobacter blaseri]QKF85968.1 cardiolipin synthase family protein [Campylobacter blaseri]
MTFIYLISIYVSTIVSGILVFIAIGHILYKKRSPNSMISWILAIFFLPFISVPLYFIIGIRKRESRSKKEYVKIAKPEKYHKYNISSSEHSVLSLLEKNKMPSATKNNDIKLILSDTKAFKEMLEQINNSKYSIDICTYVFKFDKTTQILLDALEKKAKEGVKVRVLLDIVGSIGAYIKQGKFKKAKEVGVDIVFFTPIFKRPFQSYINLRNHRKIYLFDQKILLSGGMNLSDEYMGLEEDEQRWDDLMYKLIGPSVFHFYYIFCNDWAYAKGEKNNFDIDQSLEFDGSDIVQVVPSGPDIQVDALYETLLNAIYNAKERIWIVTPYFVPSENIIQSLIIAKHKGVDVKLITPKHSNHLLADLGRSPYMRELNSAGVEVMLYRGNMLHAKAILFDSLAGMVGSVNFDNRSLFLNYEVVTFVYSKRVVDELEEWMRSLMDSSNKGMQKPSKVRETIENIVKVFTPLL